MNQYRDFDFCSKYKGCCGTCLARDEHNNICLGDCEYVNIFTPNDFSCSSYVPCEMADKMIYQDEEDLMYFLLRNRH